MAVSIEEAEWSDTARSPGEKCLQVASVGRSALHQKAQADFSPAWVGTQWAVSKFNPLVCKSPLGSINSDFPCSTSPGKSSAACQDDMSLTFKHCDRNMFFSLFQGIFVPKKGENGRAARMSLRSADHTGCQMVAAMQSA